MLQQPAQQKPTTDYSQCVSWLGSIYCDTLLYFIPLFFLLLFLPSSSPPLPLHSPPPFLHLPFPLQMLFLSSVESKKERTKPCHTCSVDSLTTSVLLCACICAVRVGLTVHCMCASCLCTSPCAAGNSKTRPYRPPRGLKAQGVPKQHGLSKKKRFQTP